MKTLSDLKQELSTFPMSQRLSALSDGEFLGSFTATEEEIEELYMQILKEIKS